MKHFLNADAEKVKVVCAKHPIANGSNFDSCIGDDQISEIYAYTWVVIEKQLDGTTDTNSGIFDVIMEVKNRMSKELLQKVSLKPFFVGSNPLLEDSLYSAIEEAKGLLFSGQTSEVYEHKNRVYIEQKQEMLIGDKMHTIEVGYCMHRFKEAEYNKEFTHASIIDVKVNGKPFAEVDFLTSDEKTSLLDYLNINHIRDSKFQIDNIIHRAEWMGSDSIKTFKGDEHWVKITGEPEKQQEVVSEKATTKKGIAA